MKLTDLAEKRLLVNKSFRGVCKGVGLSLKSHAVKYLLCASSTTQNNADFSVGVSSVCEISDAIHLSRLRPVYPKTCAKLAVGLPVYSFEGGFLGSVAEVDIKNFVATRVYTNQGEAFPITSIIACSDAVILRKEQAYPLGQRIPAPVLPLVSEKPEAVVTRAVLRSAIEKGSLVKLTLSLPPFNVIG